MNLVSLCAHEWDIDVAPHYGGSLLSCRYGGVDILRHAVSGARNPVDMACFPLVPFSNRIKEGQFVFDRQSIHLPQNAPGEPHALHGHGWQRPWYVEASDAQRCDMSYSHKAGRWPWAYRAVQSLRIEGPRLHMDISLTNLSSSLMPAGLGFHPYFPKNTGASLRFKHAGVWLNRDDAVPQRRIIPIPEWDFAHGKNVGGLEIDHCFLGFDGAAQIEWEGSPLSLTLTASHNLDHAVVYVPKGGDYFCFEPVNHMNNALNSAGLSGATPMPILPPGETMTAHMTLSISPETA